jgi:hypothetical protein
MVTLQAYDQQLAHSTTRLLQRVRALAIGFDALDYTDTKSAPEIQQIIPCRL